MRNGMQSMVVITNLLHSLCRQYQGRFFLYADTIFNTNAHTPEMLRPTIIILYIDASVPSQHVVLLEAIPVSAHGSIVIHCPFFNLPVLE